jgi:hypothetical protein
MAPSPTRDNPYEPPRSEALGLAEEPIDVPPTFFGKLATALRLYFGNLPLIAAVVLTVWLPANFLLELILEDRPDSDDPLVAMQFNNIAEAFLGPFVSGALIAALAERVEGRRAGYWAAMGVGLRRWGKVFVARLQAGLLIILGLIALIVPGVIMAVRYALIDPAVVLEGATASESRTRSTELARGQGWQIAFTGLLFPVTFAALMAGTWLLAVAFPSFNRLAGAVTADCVSDLVRSWFTCVFFLYYWGARHRKADEKEAFLPVKSMSPIAPR